MEMPAFSDESVWLIGLIVMALAVGAIIFMTNPAIQKTAVSFLCNTFYDLNFLFFGPRPPIELCGASNNAAAGAQPTSTTTTAP